MRAVRAALTTFIFGWIILSLTGGLADSLIAWTRNGGLGCYQFPYISMIGCQGFWPSWEIVWILAGAGAFMISAPAWLILSKVTAAL